MGAARKILLDFHVFIKLMLYFLAVTAKFQLVPFLLSGFYVTYTDNLQDSKVRLEAIFIRL